MEVHEPSGPTIPDGTRPRESRLTAGALAAGFWVLLAGGVLLYGEWAPELVLERSGAGKLSIQEIQLGGREQYLRVPGATPAAVDWDFLFIACYGLALFCGLQLCRRVFRSSGGQALAAVGPWLAGVAVVADVLENLFLLAALNELPGTGGLGARTSWTLFDLVAAAAVLKWCCLLPALALALAGAVVTPARLWSHRKKRLAARPPVEVRPSDPLEGDPPSPAHANDPETDASRWRRGFRVPELDASQQTGPLTGFCLSGGGIRSGSVALGALQALRTDLGSARYLVSVSGGGYTAGALQLALTRADNRTFGPLEQPTKVMREPASAYMPGSAEEDRLRRHARYLADSPSELLGALGVVARVLVLSLIVLVLPALVLGAFLGAFYGSIPLAPYRAGLLLSDPDVPMGTWWLLGLLAVVALAAFLWSLGLIAYSQKPNPGGNSRRFAQSVTSLGLLVALVAVGLPWLAYGGGRLLEADTPTSVRVGGPLLSVVLAYAVTLATVLRKKKVFDAAGSLFKKKKDGRSVVAAVPGGALQLIMVVVVLALLTAVWLLVAGGAAAVITGPDGPTVTKWTVGCLALLLLLGGVLDQTSLSLHPFYRRRLAGAFAVRRVRRADGYVSADGYAYGEATPLTSYGARVADDFPEVVFAAAANLTGEKRAALKATSFTMTAEWLGGPDVGYVRTGDLGSVVAPAFRRDMTVQAAMAISGAAFASATGRATRWYTTLLAVTGLRLGTWLPNPAFVERWNEAAEDDDWTRPGFPSLRRLTYLVREIVGSHRHTDRLLHVSDGGHYENLGLVEALRRRCTEIYCIDASGDKPPTAETFAQAVSLAYTELGVRIVLDEDAWRLVPGSGAALPPSDPLEALNKRLSDRSVLTARICYPTESGLPEGHRHGVLVLAKASLTRSLPYDLLSYASVHEVFPYDSTGDQFFDDGKFTAYTALGRAIGEEAGTAMERARRQRWSRRRCTFCPPVPRAPSDAEVVSAGQMSPDS
jgi:hypothetical protein